MRRPLLVLVLAVALLLAGCRAASPATPAPPGDVAADIVAWTLIVRSSGPRWLGPDWWRSQGLDPATVRADGVRLAQAGEPVPFRWIDAASGPGLLFLGTVTPGRGGLAGGYHLALGEGGVELPEVSPPPDALDSPQTVTLAIARLERDLKYRTTAPTGANWLWTSLVAPAAVTLTVPLTQAVAAPVTVTLRFWGQSAMPQTPDHHVQVLWDGVVIDDHVWDGAALETWSVRVPAPGEAAGPHTLTLIAPGDTEAPVDVTWLDHVTVTWQRALRREGAAGWGAWRATSAPAACWDGVPADDAPADAVRALLVDADGVPREAAVTVAPGRACVAQRPGARGWIGAPGQAPPPDVIRPRRPISEAALLAAEYVLVAPRAFHAALAPLVAARETEGLAPFLVTPEQLYDAYGTGVPTPAALRAAVMDLHARGALRYLLLVGDASARPGASLVPTGWVRTAYVGETPSDHALVADATGAPVVAVGRFPAATADEVRAMVAKTLDWTPTSRLLLLSDDEAEFATMAQALAAVQPVDRRLDAGSDAVRRDLLRWLREAPGLLVYSGHGSLPLLGDEKLLTFEDAGGWDGPTVVVAWTCLCASFTHPGTAGLSEAWLRNPQGTAAFVGPTGETTTSEQSAMALAFQRAMAAGETLGDALLAGWRAAGSRDAEMSFVLLGDPALRPMPGQE